MYSQEERQSDSYILWKYGLNPNGWRSMTILQIIMLYCIRHGYEFPLEDFAADTQMTKLNALAKTLPGKASVVLSRLMEELEADRKGVEEGSYERVDFNQKYDGKILRKAYDAVVIEPIADFCRDYPSIVIALVQETNLIGILPTSLRLSRLIYYISRDLSCEKVGCDVSRFPLLGYMMDLEDGSSHGWGEHDLKVLLAEEILCAPSTGMKTTINIEEETLLQESVAADWELNDYYDEGLSLGLHAELEEASQLTGELMDHFWKFYERGVNYILLHYDGNSRYAYETIRSIMEEGALNQVISDGEFIVIVSDFFVGGEDVTFRFFDGERLVEYEGISNPVPYSQIREYDYCLDPALYVEGDVEDGYSLVPLGELCEVDEDSMEEFVSDPKTYFALPRYHFSSDLQETFNNAYAPKQHRVSLSSDVYKGPHVHVNARGGLFLNRAPGYYMCPDEKNWALRIKDDIISPEYLAYVLNYDRRLHYILSTITPSISMLLKHKVRVLNERSRQQELVAEYLENTSPVVNSVEVYKVAVVDSDGSGLRCRSSWGIDEERYEHIQGECGLLQMLDQGDCLPDAIIADAIVDSVRDRYKGLRELLSKARSKDIPVYLYTDVSEESLSDDLYEEEYRYIVNGRYFRKSEDGSIEKLVKNLRNELDGENSLVAQIRGEYVREFEAAQWIQKRFPRLNLESQLMYFLSQPNKSFNSMRGVLCSLYKLMMAEISNGSGLDQVERPGILPELLRDGGYNYNNQRFFIVNGSIMPMPLAISLCYATKIVNGASHEEDLEKMDINGYLSQIRSEHLARSVIRIIMDFILWLYDVRFQFSGFCESRDPNELKSVDLSGILEQADTDEYYCETSSGKVHVIVPKGKVRIGAEIIISQVRYETKYHDRYDLLAPSHAWTYKSGE